MYYPYDYNPYDPYRIESSGDPDRDLRDGVIRGIVFIAMMIAVFTIAGLFTGCVTQRESYSQTERHRMETLIDRLDSLSHQRTVTQQDSVWRETILRQFQSIREKSDTSHYVVQDTAGNVIREKVVINNVREVTSESDRQEIRSMTHRLEVMDSTMQVMRQQIAHSDSLLQTEKKEVVRQVETPLTWWQQARLWLSNLVLVALALCAAVWALRRRTSITTFIRKFFIR